MLVEAIPYPDQMGVDPSVWGPSAWTLIHVVCANAPDMLNDVEIAAFRGWLTGLSGVLPCATCREHLSETFHDLPLDERALGSRAGLFAWSVELHNRVNARLGKRTWTQKEAEEHWRKVSLGRASPSGASGGSGSGGACWGVSGWWMLAAATVGVALGASVVASTCRVGRPRAR